MRRVVRITVRLGAVLLPVALLGEAGHRLLGGLGAEVAHHAFHLVFGAGAVVLFAGLVLREVRRSGLAFSWRLRPSEDEG